MIDGNYRTVSWRRGTQAQGRESSYHFPCNPQALESRARVGGSAVQSRFARTLVAVDAKLARSGIELDNVMRTVSMCKFAVASCAV